MQSWWGSPGYGVLFVGPTQGFFFVGLFVGFSGFLAYCRFYNFCYRLSTSSIKDILVKILYHNELGQLFITKIGRSCYARRVWGSPDYGVLCIEHLKPPSYIGGE